MALTNENIQELRLGYEPGKISWGKILGHGSHGAVFRVRLLENWDDSSLDCHKFKQRGYVDAAVKIITYKLDKQVNDAEYRLSRWGHQNKVGPDIYCQAIWKSRNLKYHFIFMEAFEGSLHDRDLTLSTYERHQLWGMALEKIFKLSKLNVIDADLKPANMLFHAQNGSIQEVVIGDWDPSYFFIDKDDALLLNYILFLSNSFFDLESSDFINLLPRPAQEFMRLLFKVWSRTNKFTEFLRRHSKYFQKGLYHYALGPSKKDSLEMMENAYKKKIQESKLNFIKSSQQLFVRGAEEALQAGKIKFN
jgi:hypothetical protein